MDLQPTHTVEQIDAFGGRAQICTEEKDPTTSGLEAMEDKAFTRYCERHYKFLEALENMGLPKPGEQFRIVTRRSFNAIQFLDYIAQREIVEELHIAIYSINFNAARILVNLVNSGKIRSVEVLMSNLRNKAHREKEEIIKRMLVDHRRIGLFFCSSHAKVFSCRTREGNYYTCEGSGNLAFNSRVEQYVIDNDQGMFEFTRQWMAEIREFLAGTKELEDCGRAGELPTSGSPKD